MDAMILSSDSNPSDRLFTLLIIVSSESYFTSPESEKSLLDISKLL